MSLLRKIASERLMQKTAGPIGLSASGTLGSVGSTVAGVGSSASGIGSSASATVGDVLMMPGHGISASAGSSGSSGANRYQKEMDNYINMGGTPTGWVMRKLFPLSSRLYLGSSAGSSSLAESISRGRSAERTVENLFEDFKDGADEARIPAVPDYLLNKNQGSK